MKGAKPKAGDTKQEIATVQFSRDGLHGPIVLTFRAFRDVGTGETRLHVSVPNAERLVFPDDLGVLLQCFGWGMAGMGFDLGAVDSIASWHACCRVVTKVEYCLRLE